MVRHGPPEHFDPTAEDGQTSEFSENACEGGQIQASRASWISRRWCPGRWTADPASPDGSRGGRGGPRRSRRGTWSASSAPGYSSSAPDDAVPVPTPQVGTRRPPGDLYVICNPQVAPRGVYLSKSRLESAFYPGVSWEQLPGPPDAIREYTHDELYEALQAYFQRHPRSGQVQVFK